MPVISNIFPTYFQHISNIFLQYKTEGMLGRYFLATDSWVRFVTRFSSFIVLVFSCLSIPLDLSLPNSRRSLHLPFEHLRNGAPGRGPLQQPWDSLRGTNEERLKHVSLPHHASPCPCESIFLKLNHFDRCCDLTNVSLRLKHLCVCWCCKCQEREERFCDARTKRFPEMMRPPLVTCKGVETCWNIKLYSFRDQ